MDLLGGVCTVGGGGLVCSARLTLSFQSVVFWKNIHPASDVLSDSGRSFWLRLNESIVVYSLGVPVLLYGVVHVTYGLIKVQLE